MTDRVLDGGRYRLIRLIGTGGTAEVHEAEDTTLHRPVAIKLLHDRLMQDDLLSARLVSEVQISRSLHHPGIVEVYDYRPGPPAFLVMEYMAGGDLRKRLLSLGSLPASEAGRICRSLLEALSAAHRAGVVHRDLKPRNVLFSDTGQAKIADFGLARSVTAAGLFQKGTIAGTPEYTAPETITSSLWDPRSDLYAAGCTIFEALTGLPPFVANSPAEVLRLQVEKEPPPVPEDLARDHTGLARLIAILLQKDPNSRPQTAAEALGILQGETAILVPSASRADTDTCPSCGAGISRHYGWCFTCGKPNLPVQKDTRGYAVLVTGPGKSGDKASPEFRDACCDLAEAVGLDSSVMKKKVPRLPFVLASHVDYGGASRLAAELRSAGAEVELIGDGEGSTRTLLRAVSRKALTMTPRVYLVMLGMGGAWVNIVRSVPPEALLIAFVTILATIPAILTATFARALTKWKAAGSGQLGGNVTRLLASVRDPLIHARMKSLAESSAAIASGLASDSDLDESEKLAARKWAREIAERTAGLCLALDATRRSRVYTDDALSGALVVEDDAGGSEAATDARAAADMVRDVDALYTRTLELIGRSALDIRELAVRRASVERSRAASDLRELGSIVERFGDEGEAWREIRVLENAVE